MFLVEDYKDFRTKCIEITLWSNEKIKEEFNKSPESVRDECKEYLDTITELAFFDKKYELGFHKIKDNADILTKANCNEEAIKRYNEAIKEAEKISTRILRVKLINIARLNIGRVLYQQKEYDKAIKECNIILNEEPYNTKALVLISTIQSQKGESMYSEKDLRKQTNHKTNNKDNIKKLKDKEKKEIMNRILNKAKEQTEDKLCDTICYELMSHELVISREEATKLAKECNYTKLMKTIEGADLKRRFKLFSENPSVDVLVDDAELLDEVKEAIRNPNHPFTKKLKANFKELTIEQVANSMKFIRYRAKWARVWRTATSWKTIVIFFGFIILVIAGVMWYASYTRNGPTFY